MFKEFEDYMRGYTDKDELIARDILLIELLVEKGIITQEEIENKYKYLLDKTKEVHNIIKEKQQEIINKYNVEGEDNDKS